MFSINKSFLIVICILTITYRLTAQDTLRNTNMALMNSIFGKVNSQTYKLNYKYLIAPTVFVSYGIVSLESDGLKQPNFSTKVEIAEHQPKHILLDNYSQYAPVAMVYGLTQ